MGPGRSDPAVVAANGAGIAGEASALANDDSVTLQSSAADLLHAKRAERDALLERAVALLQADERVGAPCSWARSAAATVMP